MTFFKVFKDSDKSNLSFILLFNREEVRTRTALQAQKNGDIICGIDLKTSSIEDNIYNTWLALNIKTGRIAFLTNFRSPKNNVKQGWKLRGALVKNWVEVETPQQELEFTQDLLQNLHSESKDGLYKGFNLFFGYAGPSGELTNAYDIHMDFPHPVAPLICENNLHFEDENIEEEKYLSLPTMFYVSNHNESIKEANKIYKLSRDRVYGGTNGHIEQWDKVCRGKGLFNKTLKDFEDSDSLKEIAKEFISKVMEDQEVTRYSLLPRTGFNSYFEWKVSSIFVPNNIFNFCTVSSTAIVVDKHGKGVFFERTYTHRSNYLITRM